MPKFIFILFLSFCGLKSFGQEELSNKKNDKSEISIKSIQIKKEKSEVFTEKEIDLLLNNNLCEILSIKPSDLFNEEMLKKFKANV